MSPPVAVAGRAALSTLDPALPALADVLDPRAAAALLSDSASPPLHLRRRGVIYRPGDSCVVTWEQRVESRARDQQAEVDLLVLAAHRHGVRGRRFVDDPALPGLRDAADHAVALPRLAVLLGLDVLAGSVAPVRYRPGSRCVLRYHLRTSDAVHVVYGKVLRGDVRAFADRLSGLWARAVEDAALPAPAPVLGAVPELGAVVQAEATGRPLDVGRVPGDEAALRVVGRAVLALHRLPPAGLPVRRPADDVADVRGCLSALQQASPSLGRRLARDLHRLAADPPAPGSCTTHGALRTDQVRLDGDRLVLLDLDDLCAAPGERDLANLLAYLRWRALRRPAVAAPLARARTALLDGYRDGGGPVDADVLRWYEQLSLLKIAVRRFRRLDVDEWEAVPRLLDEAAALRVPASPSSRRPSTARPAGLDLPQALDTEQMTLRLAPLLARRAEVGARPQVLSARVLASKPGVRAVVRYDVAGVSPGEAPGEERSRDRAEIVLAKLYAEPERAARLDRTLRLLALPGGVPHPLGWLAEPALAVYLPAVGDRLDELPPGLAPAVAGHVGEWLAGLHAAAVRLERQVDPVVEVRDAAAWASVVAAAHPDQGPRARELAALLDRHGSGRPPAALVPLHKDLHQGHVLARRQAGTWRLSVIDLDEARMGDPCLDVAHFCANLDLLQASGRPEAAQWRTRFLDEYTGRTGLRPGPASRFWYAHTCLKMAKQLSTGRGPWPALTGPEQRRLIAWVLTAGREALR